LSALTRYSDLLVQLANELFSPDSWRTLLSIASSKSLDREAFIDFDDSIAGPSIVRIADNRPNAPGTLGISRHGVTHCEVEDREIFRPLHYCAVDLTSNELEDVEWRTRDIVHNSGVHLEALLKRIGHIPFLPFGDALLRRLKHQIDEVTWDQLVRFKSVHNDAKHRFDNDLGTHMFSVQDAVLAYLIARRLGQKLYPTANLKSDWRFERAPSS
jgi:hypothetical protein